MSPSLLVLLTRMALASPEDALEPGSRVFFDAAVSAEQASDWSRAAAGYRLVLSHEPGFAPAMVGLGRALERAGQAREAMAVYRTLPNEPDAVDALAHLLEPERPADAAELYRRLQSLRLGEPQPYLDEARALASLDSQAALASLNVYLGLIDGEPDGAVLVAIAAGLREAGHEVAAFDLLNRYLDSWPEGSDVGEVRGRLERWRVESAARSLAVGGAEPLPEEVRQDVEAARRRAAAGHPDEAMVALRETVRTNPRSAEAWGALGEVYLALDQVSDAELAWGWATALAPDEPDWHAQLGLLLADRYGGRRDVEAAEELAAAVALRPGWAELRFRLAEVKRGLGAWDAAIQAYRASIDADPQGPWAGQAARRIADLVRVVPVPTAVAEVAGCNESVPTSVCDHYRVARVYESRGELPAARAELDLALNEAPSWPAALNLLAALQMGAGSTDDALATWRRSLAADPRQPRVLLALGEQARRRGDDSAARELYQQAAALGAGEAIYQLAELAFEAGQTDAAAALLEDYFNASSNGLTTVQASALRDQVEARIQRRRLLYAGAAALFPLALLLRWGLRRRGVSVETLASRAPETVHELCATLAALRHEVLKHNTTLLPEVARALEQGDQAAVNFAAKRLFGGDDGSTGVLERFDGYLSSLTRAGARCGVPLNLARDPVLAPMRDGMRRLRSLERRLRRPGMRRASLVAEIRALSALLNESCYLALGQLIRDISTLNITPSLLRAIDSAVRAEPAFSGQALPGLDLDLPEEGLPARITRADLEDIVANLLRNAYRAVGEELPPGRRRVGLAMDEEDDPVTGLESVLLRFRDNAPRQLDDEMIRSRSIGRGLGLVVERVTRHNGGVSVERERGWSKAVVVRLPRAETPGADGPELSLSEPALSSSPMILRQPDTGDTGPRRP